MIKKVLLTPISWLLKGVINARLVANAPIRVVERQMDGCMAHYCSREDYGTVIDHDLRRLHGSRKALDDHWLIAWDDETGRESSWYPACFFPYKDEHGVHVRTC